MPMAERAVVIVAAVSITMSAASNGMSLSSVPTDSIVRRAIVKPPTPIATVAMAIAVLTSNAPLLTSGATALGTLLAPALNAM